MFFLSQNLFFFRVFFSNNKKREEKTPKLQKKNVLLRLLRERAQGVGEIVGVLRVHTPDGIARPHAMVRPCDATFF